MIVLSIRACNAILENPLHVSNLERKKDKNHKLNTCNDNYFGSLLICFDKGLMEIKL